MAQTPSEMIPLQSTLPVFSLRDAKDVPWVKQRDSKGTLVIFMCNHCPFVIHVATILPTLHALCEAAGIQMIGINSNDIETYPDDSPVHMIAVAEQYNWTFPYLFDENQEVAKAFHATCTPDVFLYDAEGSLYYRGQIDDSRPNNCVSDGKDLIHAVQAMVRGLPSPSEQRPAIGCNIKWKD